MNFAVNAAITPRAAAKLLISCDINLSDEWPKNSVRMVFEELLSLPIGDILTIIDNNPHGETADVKYIPQFGKTSMVAKVPCYFAQKGQLCADYPQMGLFLKGDPTATLAANTKFGENHGKAAAILGIANCTNKRIVPSSLSAEFCCLDDRIKIAIIKKLLFRIPIIQVLLKASASGKVNGYYPMHELQDSTMRRRGQCLRAIFRLLKEYDDADLNARIDNILWEN